MASHNHYDLGTILAIAIPLGVVALASILAAVILGWRMSCVSARRTRERNAWSSAQSSDYRRRSANARIGSGSGPRPRSGSGSGSGSDSHSGSGPLTREVSKSDSFSKSAFISRPPGSPPKSTPPRRPSPLSPPPPLARRVETNVSSVSHSPPLALGKNWSPASQHSPPKLPGLSGLNSPGINASRLSGSGVNGDETTRSDATNATVFGDALEPLSPPSPAAAVSTPTSSSTAKTERLLRLVQDEMIQEGRVAAPRFKKGHNSIASLSGSLVSSTGGNGNGNGSDTPLKQTRAPRLNDVSEQDDSASFGLSRLTDMRSSLELLGNRISVASSKSRSSSLASSYGTAQPLLQPPLAANGDTQSHASSSIRLISGLQSPRMGGIGAGNDSAAASLRKKLRRNSTDAYGSKKLNKPLPAPPVMHIPPPQSQEGILADLRGAVFRAIVKYKPQLSDELELNIDDEVKVFQLFDDGWCLGRKTVQGHEVQGICPESCLLRL